MSLTILLGDYGSGKTATAKYLAKKTGGAYLDVDLLSQRKGNYDNFALVTKLKTIIKPGVDYFMDGFPSGYYYGVLTSETLGVKVKYITCMADPKAVRQRQGKKASGVITPLPRSYDEIKGITYLSASIALAYDSNPLFADTTTRPPTFWEKHNWFIRWLEICIYSALKDAGEYQDVELSDRTIVGLSKSYKTWNRLSPLIDFDGKSIIDYGCNYGYFCFKAEEASASSVIGVDESQGVLDMATSIAMTKGSRARFVASELKDFDPPGTDIIMALNILHHLNYDNSVINRMFARASMVVLEMPAMDLPIVDAIARSHRFGQPIIASSHREDRCIIIFSKAKPVVLPRRFVYHPRRAAFIKWLFHMSKKCLPKPHFGIARRIKRRFCNEKRFERLAKISFSSRS